MEYIELVKNYLTLGNHFQTIVKIRYQYLDKTFGRTEREAFIQPIRFEEGRNGLHVLAWDLERNGYRRFAVLNIHEICLTDMKWSKKIKQVI